MIVTTLHITSRGKTETEQRLSMKECRRYVRQHRNVHTLPNGKRDGSIWCHVSVRSTDTAMRSRSSPGFRRIPYKPKYDIGNRKQEMKRCATAKCRNRVRGKRVRAGATLCGPCAFG